MKIVVKLNNMGQGAGMLNVSIVRRCTCDDETCTAVVTCSSFRWLPIQVSDNRVLGRCLVRN